MKSITISQVYLQKSKYDEEKKGYVEIVPPNIVRYEKEVKYYDEVEFEKIGYLGINYEEYLKNVFIKGHYDLDQEVYGSAKKPYIHGYVFRIRP